VRDIYNDIFKGDSLMDENTINDILARLTALEETVATLTLDTSDDFLDDFKDDAEDLEEADEDYADEGDSDEDFDDESNDQE
jgi:hypothetical protein